MKKFVLVIVAAAALCHGAVREVRPTLNLLPPYAEPPTLAERIEQRARSAAIRERGRAMRELAGIISTNTLDSIAISNQVAQIRERGAMLLGLSTVIADTRTNIVETADLADAEIAGLYIRQMRKAAPPLIEAAQTNTIEYAIGAGMREDLKKE